MGGRRAISLAGAARRFAVSRFHVRGVLDEAERAHLLRWTAQGTVVLEEKGRAEIEYLYAGQLTQLLASAAGTIRERPELATRSPLRSAASGREG